MKTTHLVIFEMENGKRRELHTTVLRPDQGASDVVKKYEILLKTTREVDDFELPHPKHD